MLDAMMTRIGAIDPNPFKLVAGAAALAALTQNLPPRDKLPHAYCYPAGHSGGRNESGTVVTQQKVTGRYGVAYLAAALAQREGGAAAVEMEDLYTAVRKQLVGWMPADTAEESYRAPMLFEGGRLLEIEAGIILWTDVFTIDMTLRRAS